MSNGKYHSYFSLEKSRAVRCGEMPVRFRVCRRRRFVRQSRECRRKRTSSELENWAPGGSSNHHCADPPPEEAECEEHFQQTHTRDISGGYIVWLPLISAPRELGDFYTTVHACLNRLIQWITRDENYHQLYSEFLTEYGSLGHMVRVPDNSRSGSAIGGREGGRTLAHAASSVGGLGVPHERSSAQTRINLASHYLPHHGVLKL